MRKMGPLHNHPLIGDICPICKQPFEEGQFVTLCGLWPADDEELAKAKAGRPYNMEAQPLHWDCKDHAYVM